ncbi:MAG: efflux transporter periplasmic adaptor subunit, partial [Acidobacteria bacterium]|nr:efflux transporter periplasmic adaptor subunit [Acidobacteriota bacterium]
MKKRRRLILWGVGLAALVALIALGSRPRPIPVDIAAVVQGTLSVTLDEEGETRVRDRFEISAPVAGRVLRIELEPGDPVLAAESVLATFLPASPVPLDPRQRAEAEAAVEAAEAAVGRVEALHEQAAQERAFAESTLNRLRRLQEEGVSSEEALEMAQLELDTRQEALE